MKELSYRLRLAVIDAISPLIFDSVEIPVFDQVVNPSTQLPIIRGAQTYVLVNNQSQSETTNNKCTNRFNGNLTFDVVTKYPKNMGGSLVSELIGELIMNEINNTLEIDSFQLLNVNMNFNSNLHEQGKSETAFRKIISYSFDTFEI
jgi:hypothetical protein